MLAYKDFWDLGVNYHQYQQRFIERADDSGSHRYGEYIKLNLHRSQRIEKMLILEADIQNRLANINQQQWLIISEHWCGDAAQTVPIMAKMAELSNGQIKLKLIYRDDYPELMDAHLTNGGKAVPKIIQLNNNFHFIQDWGPRPTEAQELVQELRSNPETAKNYAEPLHKWYAKDKQNSTVQELVELAEKL